MRIALVGTRGVPARYGGFETAVEEVGRRLVDRGHDVLVYCREPGEGRYLGMRRVHLPSVPSKTLETLSHTGLSAMHLVGQRVDVAVVFNAANAPFVPLLRARGIPVAVHVDGLESRRGKWGRFGQRYYLACERLAVRVANALIADAVAIGDYYREQYAAESWFIPYGAPLLAPEAARPELLARHGLEPERYHLVVARMEPENNVDLFVRGYVASRAAAPLVVVGGAPYGDRYTAEVHAAAEGDPRVRFVGPEWDQAVLDALYAGALTYLHGHSVGGTNPSLLRAMGAAAPVVAVDVPFTREVLGSTGVFVSTAQEAAAAVEAAEADPAVARERGRAARERAAERYRWDDVADRYEELAYALADGCDGGLAAADADVPAFEG